MKEGAPNLIPEDINFHEVQKERKEVLPEVLEQTPGEYKAEVQELLDEAEEKAKVFNKDNFPTLSSAKKRLKKDKERSEKSKWLDEEAIADAVPEFTKIESLSTKLRDSQDFEMNLINRKRINPNAKTLDSILKTISKEKTAIKGELERIEQDSPVAFRAHELVAYKRGLHQEGHIAHTPSVQGHIEEIGRRTVVGKPMFLHGPTGTGKTSLARYSALHFTGKPPEMVYCTPQTKESNIWGKTGIRPVKNGEAGQIETVDIFGPLAKGMTEGRIVIFDEFTALPQEQMVFIKGIMNAKVGDRVNVVGNGQVEIMPGFQIICTANLKSDKNPERSSLPPEIAREFEQNNLEIGYTPKEESYDIMLARLMDPDGSIDISYEDIQHTLPRFAEAMDEIQIAYTDRQSMDEARLTGTMDASGKAPGLKKMVMTQGTVEAILDAWKSERQINPDHVSFSEFLDIRFKTGLTFKEYSEADRILVAKILASKGFLKTFSPQDLGLPANTFDFDLSKKMRGEEAVQEMKDKSGQEKHISLLELADIDPFNRRADKVRDIAEGFLPEEEKAKTKNKVEGKESINTAMTQFLSETYKNWGVSQATLDSIQWRQEVSLPRNIDYTAKKDDVDVAKFGEFIMNPDTKDIDWDKIPLNKIKVIELPLNMKGKPLSEVADFIVATYGSKYKIPGLEYYKYICENPDKAPDSLKNGNYHFFFGSLFRYSRGFWDVPGVVGVASGFSRDGGRLGSGWSGLCRVVLLEN